MAGPLIVKLDGSAFSACNMMYWWSAMRSEHLEVDLCKLINDEMNTVVFPSPVNERGRKRFLSIQNKVDGSEIPECIGLRSWC